MKQRALRVVNKDVINARGRLEYSKTRWSAHIKRKYGIDAEMFARLLASQNGCCAICNVGEVGGRAKRFHVDHCHKTGMVRGLLCTRCNQLLGYAGDRAEILEKAADYLKQSRGQFAA